MVSGFIRSFLIVVVILIFEIIFYVAVIKPEITVWGTASDERVMAMAGDTDDTKIVSTRAIDINAPKDLVWKWLMQLGAYRGGFFSYYFIEKALGYKTQYPDLPIPKFPAFKKGDLVAGSMDEKASVIPYNFALLRVVPEQTFVLDNWGTFLVKALDDKTTRLIIRTQEPNSTDFVSDLKQALALPMHFIMERRLMYGFKIKAEGVNSLGITPIKDTFWFIGLVLSWGVIIVLAFVIQSVMSRIIVPSVLGAVWLAVLYLLPPLPIYTSVFLLFVCLVLYGLRLSRKRTSLLISSTSQN
jgi:hypothetical protein